jgi:uncharacterized hydantoinase/oxoprolinase family protein
MWRTRKPGQIADGIRQVQQRIGDRAPRVALLAGSGAFLARAAAEAAGLATRDLAGELGAAGALAAPAVAVAHLLSDLLCTGR